MEELILNKKKYISSKRAAKLSGYTKDYIGQLCRAGALPAKMVGRSWYIEEDSLNEHRKTYQGEPLIDSSVWDVGHIEEDSRSLQEIAAEYVDKQEEDKKKYLLNQLFELKYEKDSGPLLPKIAGKELRIAPSSMKKEEGGVKITRGSEGLSVTIKKEGKREAEGGAQQQVFSPASPAILEKVSKVVYFNPDTVRPSVSHTRKRARSRREQHALPPRKTKKLVYTAISILLLFLLSSVFIEQKKTYERRGADYVISSENIALRGFDDLLQRTRGLFATVITSLE